MDWLRGLLVTVQAVTVVWLSIAGIVLTSKIVARRTRRCLFFVFVIGGSLGYPAATVLLFIHNEERVTDATWNGRYSTLDTSLVATRLQPQSSPNLRINEPLNGDRVTSRQMVKGTVSNPTAEVWVVIHPMEVAEYWVQPRLTVREDGTWKVSAYVGREGMDSGKDFEIMAVANPRNPLSEGMKLSGWPEAEWYSNVIDITRR